MPVTGNSAAGYPQGLKKYPHYRFMPRLGFAFRPMNNDKWVIRGGAGMYNINMLGSSFYSLTGTVQAYTAAVLQQLHTGDEQHTCGDWLSVAEYLRGCGFCRLHHMLRYGLLRYS